MPTTDPAMSPPPLRFAQWIDRHRRYWFALVAVMLVISFNGKWQVGPDSAAYRGLGHNLAAHGKYFFRETVLGVEEYANQQGTRYPGLPILLAGLEKVFGERALPPLILMNGIVVLLLVLTYRLMLYRVPRWVAVSVICGMGTNARFLQYSNEILTDIPFLLGLVMAMLGYEWLLRAKGPGSLLAAAALLLPGLLLAASMRPTVLFFAGAIVIACLWGLMTERAGIARAFDAHQPPAPPTPQWKFLIVPGALVLAAVVFLLAIDLRSKHGVMKGGYESHVFTRLDKLIRLSPESTHEMLESALPVAFFGMPLGGGFIGPSPDATDEITRQKRANRTIGAVSEHLKGNKFGFSTLYSLAVIGAGIALIRRNVLWGALVLVSITAFIITGAVPRYFVMILPLLLAGWALFSQWIARRFRSVLMADLALLAGLGTVVGMNLVVAGDFILKQHGYTRPLTDDLKWQGFKHLGFAKVHHKGIWDGVYDLAAMIRANTKPEDKLLGPEATVLTYLCDRQVYLPKAAETQQLNSKRGDSSYFKLAIIPTLESPGHFHDYNAVITDLARLGLITTGKVIAGPVAGYKLVEFAVVPPHPRGPRHRTGSKPTTLPVPNAEE